MSGIPETAYVSVVTLIGVGDRPSVPGRTTSTAMPSFNLIDWGARVPSGGSKVSIDGVVGGAMMTSSRGELGPAPATTAPPAQCRRAATALVESRSLPYPANDSRRSGEPVGAENHDASTPSGVLATTYASRNAGVSVKSKTCGLVVASGWA